jgi:hypothetical protein
MTLREQWVRDSLKLASQVKAKGSVRQVCPIPFISPFLICYCMSIESLALR